MIVPNQQTDHCIQLFGRPSWIHTKRTIQTKGHIISIKHRISPTKMPSRNWWWLVVLLVLPSGKLTSIAGWKITIFQFGKSTISMGNFFYSYLGKLSYFTELRPFGDDFPDHDYRVLGRNFSAQGWDWPHPKEERALEGQGNHQRRGRYPLVD